MKFSLRFHVHARPAKMALSPAKFFHMDAVLAPKYGHLQYVTSKRPASTPYIGYIFLFLYTFLYKLFFSKIICYFLAGRLDLNEIKSYFMVLNPRPPKENLPGRTWTHLDVNIKTSLKRVKNANY